MTTDRDTIDYYEHEIADTKEVAHRMLRDGGLDLNTFHGVWGTPTIIEHGPMVTIVLTLEMPGGGEADCLMVVGFAIPHDGQLTVAVNHMDGLAVHDNAEEMFPS